MIAHILKIILRHDPCMNAHGHTTSQFWSSYWYPQHAYTMWYYPQHASSIVLVENRLQQLRKMQIKMRRIKRETSYKAIAALRRKCLALHQQSENKNKHIKGCTK